ncbi:MAG: NADH-quinone oxidoreductase subunit M [Nitrococcus mobilis]|nr:NADH-quinone oxidoreductase subunit M [Nitrococcus mobilis]
MTLAWLIAIPLGGAVLAWLAGGFAGPWPRLIALAALALDLALALSLCWNHPLSLALPGNDSWLMRLDLPWIPRFGISLLLAVDGLSLILVLLTLVLGLVSVAASWTEIRARVGFFHFNLLATLAGVIGVFLALDLFLFFFFWEVMLIPMYFLIGIWGHENRVYSTLKFFIFTQASGLLMLLSIVALALVHQRQSGVLSFSYFDLLGTSLAPDSALLLMLGFFLAFAVKLPMVPFHTWLPDAHTDAPSAGSVILAGVLLKSGAYGLLRFITPLFPEAAAQFTPVVMALAVIGILYGGLVAFAQSDFKRLVAYTSISHMGFVLLGVFAWNELALQGVVVQIIAHGLSTGALFIIAGALQERLHTRELARMGGGIWSLAPRLSAVGLFFALASLGLPGLANFIGEFLVLAGAYQTSAGVTAVAAAGLVVAAIYALWLVQQAFHGVAPQGLALADLDAREMTVLGVMIGLVVWLGVNPQPVLNLAAPALDGLQQLANI